MSTAARIRGLLRHFRKPQKIRDYFINLAIEAVDGENYLEIGVRHGICFRRVEIANKIGVDPVRTEAMKSLREGERFFEAESDTFFREIAADALRDFPLDVAFVDGMHECKQVFRDVINVRKYLKPGGVILLHDCNPAHKRMTGEPQPGELWTGDVWKTAYLLSNHADGATYFTIDADFGVGVLTDLHRAPEWDSEEAFQKAGAIMDAVGFEVLEDNREKAINLSSVEHAERFFRDFARRREDIRIPSGS